MTSAKFFDAFSLVVTRGHLWSTRGHSWSFVVTRGHSWSLVVTRGHSCVLLDTTDCNSLKLCLLIKMQITATKLKAVKIILPILAVISGVCCFIAFEIFNNNNNFISINTVHSFIALKVDVL